MADNNFLDTYESGFIPSEDKPSVRSRSSAGSLYSAQDDIELKKKFMQGFDEMKDADHMICKRLRKNLPAHEDFFENVPDLQAFSVMFPSHKASKFGQKQKRKISKNTLNS